MRIRRKSCTRHTFRSLELALAAGLAAVGAGRVSAQQAGGGAVDACALLTAAEVHTLAPSLGAGHPSKTQRPNVATCQWDNAHGLPALMLEVVPAGTSTIKESLEEGMGPMGYKVTEVPGLGDDAAVAVQQANPKYNIQAGVAILAVRVGQRVIQLSPAGLTIAGPGSAGFNALEKAAAAAVHRLKSAAG